jgi:hypothetical protein
VGIVAKVTGFAGVNSKRMLTGCNCEAQYDLNEGAANVKVYAIKPTTIV